MKHKGRSKESKTAESKKINVPCILKPTKLPNSRPDFKGDKKNAEERGRMIQCKREEYKKDVKKAT